MADQNTAEGEKDRKRDEAKQQHRHIILHKNKCCASLEAKQGCPLHGGRLSDVSIRTIMSAVTV